MAGIKIKVNVDEAKVATTELRKAFNSLGLETKATEKDIRKLEQRMLKKMGADKGKAALDKLKQSAKLTRLEVAKLQMKTGNLSGAMSTLKGGLTSVGRSVLSLKTAIGGLIGIYGLMRLSRSFTEAAVASEGYRTRLNALLGSTAEGTKLFQAMAEYAGKVPFQYAEIMDAATTLSGVMRGGVDEIKRWMPMIGDLAAATGLDIITTTSQVVRMYSAGASAADLFRERGVLAMMGFKAGVRYTTEETTRMMFEAWNAADSKFKDVTKELAKTWEGAMSMFADKWFQFRNLVMDAGPFQVMKEQATALLTELERFKKEGKMDEWAHETAKAIITSFQYAAKGVLLFINTVRGIELVFSGTVTAVATLGEKFISVLLKIAEIQKSIIELAPGGKWLTGGLDDSIAGLKSARSEMEHLKNAGAAMSNALIEAMANTDKQFKGFIDTLEDMKATAKVEDLIEGLEDWTMHFEKVKKKVELTKEEIKKLKKETADYVKLAKTLAAIEYGPPFDWEAMIPTEVQVHTMEAYVRLAKELARLEYAPPFDWEQWIPTDPTKEVEQQLSLTEKSIEEFLNRVQGAFADTFYDIFSGQLDGWKDMLETMKNLFLRTLSELAAAALREEIKLAVTSQTTGAGAGAGIGMLGGAAIGVGALYAAYKIGEGIKAKRAAEYEAARQASIVLTQALMDIYDQAMTMIDPLDSVSAGLKRVDNQFDDWIRTLSDLGASVSEITKLEEKRAEALANVRERLKKEFEEPLGDMIAGITMAPREYELYKLDKWYETQIDAARVLGEETVKLLREAYELAKKEYILKEKALLLAQPAEFGKLVERLGMSPMELTLQAIEDWRENIQESWKPVQDEIDTLPGIITGYRQEISDLEALRVEALGMEAGAIAAWESAYHTFEDSLKDMWKGHWKRITAAAKDTISWWESEGVGTELAYGRALRWMERFPTWEDILPSEGVLPSLEDWTPGGRVLPIGTDPSYITAQHRAYMTARKEFEAIMASLAITLESIPGEIADIERAIIDKNKEIQALIETLGEAGMAEAAAYIAQIQHLTEQFTGGLLDIIRSHTLSDYEQQLYALNEWYKEQTTVAEALGTGLDLVNYAYQLQFEALQELNDESEDFTGTLEEWKSVLESVEDQILRLRTSMASPLTAVERMGILQQEIAGYGTPTSPDDVRRLQDLWSDYLNVAQEAYQRPSAEYQTIYYSVLDALEGLKGVAEEQISDYEVQIAQLAAQERMATALEAIIPLQYGTNYVPETGLYKLHQGEQVIPSSTTTLSFVVQINESKSPRTTGIAVRKEFEMFLKSPIGGKLIQQRSKGRI